MRHLLYRPARETTRCACCGSTKIRHLEATHQRKMPGTEERVAFISGCRDCGAVFINPRPESDTLKSCYAPDGEWARNRAVSEQTRNETLRALKVERYAEMLARLAALGVDCRQPFGSGEALDFGCGPGFFMDALAKCGWHCAGIDPATAPFLTRHRMLDTIPETRQFSLISALHVLEHVDGQVDLLRKFRGCLHEDGILLIAVPSFHELPKHTRKHYCINYPNHIVALTDRAIETILAMAGFDLLSGTANVWANSYLVAARRSATAAAKISRKPLSAAIAALKDSKTGDIRSGWLWRRLPIRYRAARMNAFYTGKIKRRRERKARRQQEAAEIVPRA